MQYDKAKQHHIISNMKKVQLRDYVYELIQVADGLLEYIDAIPDDVVLPAMPGVDRDWIEDVLCNCNCTEHDDGGFKL